MGSGVSIDPAATLSALGSLDRAIQMKDQEIAELRRELKILQGDREALVAAVRSKIRAVSQPLPLFDGDRSFTDVAPHPDDHAA